MRTMLKALAIFAGVGLAFWWILTPLAGVVLSNATGTSMLPAIDGNVLVLKEPASREDLNVGDVVVFNRAEYGDDAMTNHRIIALSEGGYIIKGDNNAEADRKGEPVSFDEIDYKVIMVLPKWVEYNFVMSFRPIWLALVLIVCLSVLHATKRRLC